MNFPNLIPDPWRLAARVFMVFIVLLGAYAAGRSDGAARVEARWEADKALQAEKVARAERVAREREFLNNERIRKAESDAETRQNQSRLLAADLDTTQQRLRVALNTIRRGLPGQSGAANGDTADAALAVFGECAAEVGRLAEAADGHASDVRTLTEAWPK